jgi:uncharacterized protein YjbJ (UPF0337 family)
VARSWVELKVQKNNNNKEKTMNKDQVKGKLKDVGGRVERQVGEWTGDTEKQASGAAKQVEGKVQNAWGDVKEAGKKAADNLKHEKDVPEADQSIETIETEDRKKVHTTRRKAS